MLYWLRRNNIDNGPFTKEALLSQGLHPSDLVKVDGGSEWKPPSSFAELQQDLQAAPKPKYKFTADKKLIEIKEEVPPKPEVPSLKSDKSDKPEKPETPQGPSPFKRMPSAVPKKKATPSPAVDPTAAVNIEKAKERARLNSRVEKPAETITPQPPPHLQAHATVNGHQKVHTQVQSLDEAPFREVRHHPTPKPIRATSRPQNSHFFKEFFLPIIIIGGIGFLAWWGYKQFTTPSSVPALSATSLAGADSLQSESNPQDSQKNNTAKAEGPAAIPLHPSDEKGNRQTAMQGPAANDSTKTATAQPATTGAAQTKAAPAPTTVTTAPVPANVNKKSETQNTPGQKDGDSDKNNTTESAKDVPVKAAVPVEKKTDTPAATAKKEPEQKAPVKKAQNNASIGDYVSLSLNKAPESGIKNVKIKVQNTSKDDLNIAVVEIKYYDKDGKFIQGETLQSGKINAGKSTTLKVPSSKNAERISYKVSLISGDNVYLMGR